MRGWFNNSDRCFISSHVPQPHAQLCLKTNSPENQGGNEVFHSLITSLLVKTMSHHRASLGDKGKTVSDRQFPPSSYKHVITPRQVAFHLC